MVTTRSPFDLRKAIEGGLLSFPLTDFDATTEAFDARAYRARLNWLGRYGAAGLFPAGGAGEYFSLADDEYRAVIGETVAWSDGRVPVIAAAGMGTRAAVAHAKAAEQLGADGLLLLPPYMTEASQAGLAEHVATVCDAVGIGVIVYNRGNCRLAPATVAQLAARCANMIGIKDGLGTVEWLLGMRSLVGDRLIFINGMPTAEVYAQAYRAMGAPTYSSAIFNFIPRTAKAYHAAVMTGDQQTCDAIFTRFFMPYLELRNRQPGYAVSIVKAGVDIINRSAGPVRSPLSGLTLEERAMLARLIEAEGPQGADDLPVAGRHEGARA
ncbi:5-dehydro-4-deoxyglucarate dehydratase [Lichenifustis flavocetrariae]|uniref:5-dehydro-4-deoxyglucarate dehydratase n=1 Tax=Lichenifustis flavocetrariae TaxID=2949735 RepID=A0AA41Z0A4_9HYPH|nr:5-dehydro-4-deoxyglucarate dehydratase [Lichenifustis flavocetrariae]MCW6506957.1 5-dehydro-4-deoxyglucarate dehydratase [Lichenifustis flavocetrariae]